MPQRGGGHGGPAPAQAEAAGLVEQLQREARAQRLHESKVWHSLLHAAGTRAYVRDRNFLLSLPDFTPEAEMTRTIAFLYGGSPANVCRFPARYQFLRNRLHAPALPLQDCAEVSEFREKAPAERISLVFANENLAQPASMMGHGFLKIAGRDRSGNEVSHAISFYTETANIPKLLYESTVTGKPGYFTLSPYREAVEQYVNNEQRSVWEYPLQLAEPEKELLLLHLLELRQAQFTYCFQDYNCATLVYFELATAGERRDAAGRRQAHRPRRVCRQCRILTLDRWLVLHWTFRLHRF